ncbi:hypothetical protein [Roseomonas elaeocarpi]|uniref:Uncharacterized protein n=1 Tax=Roseomonas elaeocarpi TaxID=907779 RepID=A0ABV6JTR2_9PROT
MTANPGDDLLDATGAGPQDRVLIVGGSGADLLCASVRRGCRSAVGMARPSTHPEPADVVLAPDVRTAEDASSVAASARRALIAGRQGGRLALRLLAGGAPLVGEVVRRLQQQGFAGIRATMSSGRGLVLTCRLGRRPVVG